VATDETVEIPADTVIAAVGERPDTEFYRRCSLALDEKGLPVVHPETGESSLKGVYIAGDGPPRAGNGGEAIADAAKVASALTGAGYEEYAPLNAAKAIECPRKKGCLLHRRWRREQALPGVQYGLRGLRGRVSQ
jgi:putative selenate reductase